MVQLRAELARDLDEVAVSRTDLRDLVALLEALKPVVVDREALAVAIRAHSLYPADKVEPLPTCGCGWQPDPSSSVMTSDHARHVAAVLAALYPKATEPVRTCTVTPTLRTLDRECPVHWSPIPKATEGKS